MTDIKPLNFNVILKRYHVENKSKAGIILASKPEHQSNYATVVAVGPKVRDIKPGDHVMIPGWNRSDLKIDGQDHICVEEKDIIGVIEE
jgi:chaperonin GroES